MNAPHVALVVLALSQVVAAHAELEFSGYITVGATMRFVLTDTGSQEPSSWLQIGDTFHGHKLLTFDPASEVLTVEHQGESIRLSLRSSRVKDARSRTAEGAQVHLATRADGSFKLEGRNLTEDELRTYFRGLAAEGIPVELLVQEPPDPTQLSFATATKLMRILRESGVKKWKFRIIHSKAK